MLVDLAQAVLVAALVAAAALVDSEVLVVPVDSAVAVLAAVETVAAGVSRQWGGIHAISAYTGGRVAADSVHAAVRAALGGLSSS